MISGVTMRINIDEYLMNALKEDITQEDVSTNAVMPEPKQGELKKFSLSDLMSKTENTKSVWGQTKSVFNDTTEIISELAEGTSEAVKTLRKALNLANLQLDEMIIQQKIGIFTTLMESGFSDEQALSIIVTQIRN